MPEIREQASLTKKPGQAGIGHKMFEIMKAIKKFEENAA